MNACLLSALFALLLTQGSPPEADPKLLHVTGELFTTEFSVKVVDPPPSLGEKTLLDLIERTGQAVNDHLSLYRQGSELDRLNHAQAGVRFPLSADLEKMLSLSKEIYSLSGGAFDPTVAPLVRLWGFNDGETRDSAPPAAELTAARALVGLDKLVLEKGFATKRVSGTTLDLSGIAKGYAVDLIAEAIVAAGAKRYMVEVGGEVRCAGHGPQGEHWRIGVVDPASTGGALSRILELNELSLATSGDYRNGYFLEGKYISHTIDPKTGAPVGHGLASVTVVDSTCARADALATALEVLGPRKGLEFATSQNLAAYFIQRLPDDSLRQFQSPAFTTLFGQPTPPGKDSPLRLLAVVFGVFLLAALLLGISRLFGRKVSIHRCRGAACDCEKPPKDCQTRNQ